MPKMKTHRGTAKRVKVTGTGKFIVKHSGKSHILTKKTRKRKNNLKKDFVVSEGSARKLRVLLPTGR
ncbi:MAG: 50S ribosomal protein L35 [Fusobacteriaceae bacterium]|jgi:large subunit ribosomal protein L35|nr:50S ribosomal protein L35 [Fusobacteriaceae bacterium]MBP6468148.1 50S ribosomal protein L35 [Fusobacteriaceae bacterium]MBP9596379.1 50S ribosomal protein L35 [Fusobacteriaceae bacterium]MBU9918570.1 50S ribosomal protein L35 [Fusobacteriaceae bacterium]